MLPFLQKKAVGGITTQVRKPDRPEESDQDAPLKACAQDLIDGCQAGDVHRVAEALRCAFEILEGEPHAEGPHLDQSDSE